MINWLLRIIFGTKNARELKRIQPLVARVNSFEPELRKLSDDALRAKTAEFKRRLDKGEPLDDLLPEAFAVVREAAWRAIGQRHYDVQLVGGVVLHHGKIAEMKTGEGKTLVATLPCYLNALAGKGVHVITVNDYLAKRDSEWMGKIHKFLGLTVGCVVHGLSDRQRQVAYRSDITYGMNSEFGFDYLRDNMKTAVDRMVQRDLHYALVDEVDSILIDEARTPLIISGPAEQSADLYFRVNQMIPSLKKDVDYVVDEEHQAVSLTDQGVERVEKKLNIPNLYEPENIEWLHHVQQALRAHTLYKRDVQYVVEEGKVIIIDEFTGRKMAGRRWSDGLHQAVEAKENVEVEEENQTLATISYQNYFRMYKKLAGMTGTAETEAEEFHKIYKLEVAVIPTNRPMTRKDHDDVIWKSEKSKFRQIIDEIEKVNKQGRPILVGTISVEKSEVLASLLKRRGIAHNVLNAKHHENEAMVVAQAGRKGAVTISTNMAGRGTDILLGGNSEYLAKQDAGPEPDLWDPELEPDQRNERRQEHALWKERYERALAQTKEQCAAEHDEIVAVGGLHILGSERHESRRIDNQLRGRAGRQGDPGSSKFHLSLEDDLMRIFGGDRLPQLMERLGMEEDTPIEHRWVNRSIENAQKRVEGQHFDSRKHLLEYDDVMNQQRKTVYALRRQVLEGTYAPGLTEDEMKAGKQPLPPPTKSGQWTMETLGQRLRPRVAQLVDVHVELLRQAQIEAVAQGMPGIVPIAEGVFSVDPDRLRADIYKTFGAAVDFHAVSSDREACLRKATDEVASSLIQQRERLFDLADQTIATLVDQYCPHKSHPEEWNLDALRDAVGERFNFKCELKGLRNAEQNAVAENLWDQVEKVIEARENDLGPIALLYFFRHFYLETIDSQWIDHLKVMDHLREGIGLRGYGQRDPKQEYKKEGYELFAALMGRMQDDVCEKLFRVRVERQDEVKEFKHKERKIMLGSTPGSDRPAKQQTVRRDAPKVGRNDPCPCGSGRKYKKCHMARAA